MPAIRVTITLPYYLRLAEGDYAGPGGAEIAVPHSAHRPGFATIGIQQCGQWRMARNCHDFAIQSNGV